MKMNRIVNKYSTCPGQRVRIINRNDTDEYVTYSLVKYITEEIDHDGNRFIVLHHEDAETSTFNMADWKVAISAFVPLW